MPVSFTNNGQEARHTDDMQDIITKVPSWILKWGISLFFAVLVLMVALSSLIRYPDIVKATLKIYSPDAPKPIISKISGKVVKLLVSENETVYAGQQLAYLESTGNHSKITTLLTNLKQIQNDVLQSKQVNRILLNQADNIQLGELQTAYQTFYSEYLSYISVINNGFLLQKRRYLENDLQSLSNQQKQLLSQKEIQQRDLTLADQEFTMHKKLAGEKIETQAEYRQEESKYLAKQSPLIQTESSIITGNDNYAAKQKEILELDNQIVEEKNKFLQALNSLISAAEDWESKYILSSPQAGKITFAGVIQENQILSQNQEVFYINPGNEHFFGEMSIPQNSIGKVKQGQRVLIKLRGYPFEEFGMLKGYINNISDVPYKDSVFISKVNFKFKNQTDLKRSIHLKQGMIADAEIVTQDATIFQRISWSLLKLNN